MKLKPEINVREATAGSEAIRLSTRAKISSEWSCDVPGGKVTAQMCIRDREIKANFYKCGDELQTPHFLSWNPIKIENPDFHRPDFFGTLEFE